VWRAMAQRMRRMAIDGEAQAAAATPYAMSACLHVPLVHEQGCACVKRRRIGARARLDKVDQNAEGKALKTTRLWAWMSKQPFGLWLARTGASSL
jgi:hypothetical protein